MQVYMAYMELTNGMFTCENQDTCEVYLEIVPFDAAAAQEASDRGVRVVSARSIEELPQIARDATDFRCKFCDFKERCWRSPAVAEVGRVAAWGSWGAPTS